MRYVSLKDRVLVLYEWLADIHGRKRILQITDQSLHHRQSQTRKLTLNMMGSCRAAEG